MKNDQREIVVLQHIECEPAGTYADVLEARGYAVTAICAANIDMYPAIDRPTGLLIMGGPMSAGEERANPWLVQEKRYIDRALSAGVPTFGVCLGAQLIAAVCGARVYPVSDGPEVGTAPVSLTSAGRTATLTAGLPDTFPALHWHSDTFDLPYGAQLLARTERCVNQAFSLGSACGLQFHLEVAPHVATEWLAIPEYRDSLESVHGRGAASAVIAAYERQHAQMDRAARSIIENWLRTVSDAAVGAGSSRDAKARNR